MWSTWEVKWSRRSARAPAGNSLQIVGFSPQGDRILYGIFDANGLGVSLWSVDADGSNARLLVAGDRLGRLATLVEHRLSPSAASRGLPCRSWRPAGQ